MLDKCSFVCGNALMNTCSVSEFSKIVGVSVKTLQRWDREKKLIPLRSLSNRRVYTEEHLSKAVGITISKKERGGFRNPDLKLSDRICTCPKSQCSNQLREKL